MQKISRENTLVRKFSLVVISTVEKNLASLVPFHNGVETNSTTRRREIFRRETFQNHVAHAFKLLARNFSHFARRGFTVSIGIAKLKFKIRTCPISLKEADESVSG
jgi:hypothetical protein